MTPNNDEVICPNCVHQFRAIPQNVQQLMLDAGFEPPFTTPPQRTWVGLTDDEVVSLKMLGRDLEFVSMTALRRFARDIGQTLKEKNNG